VGGAKSVHVTTSAVNLYYKMWVDLILCWVV